MTIATVALPILLAAFDIGEAFKETEAWEESAVDFAVDRAKDGFKFADAKRNAVVCMKRGACTWNGLEVWEDVAPISARLIVNTVSMKLKQQRITEIVKQIEENL